MVAPDHEDGVTAKSNSPQPWHRLRRESATAHSAFTRFLELGPGRSIAQVARTMNRSPSLLYRWSSKYRWSERAWQRDQAYGREQEAALRDERQEMARRQLRDSDRLQRLSMAKLTSLVRRDPDTGELQLDPSVKPRDAVAIYRLALEIQEAAAAAAAPEKEATESSDDQLGRLSDSELQQIIQLAKERASDDESTKED